MKILSAEAELFYSNRGGEREKERERERDGQMDRQI
jgi:hypothetical protein